MARQSMATGDADDQPARAPIAVREQLTNMRALLVLSILMTESADEDQILRLACSCAPSLGPWWVEGFAFTDGTWRSGQHGATGAIPAWIRDDVAALSPAGGAIASVPTGWGWAFPLRSIGTAIGYLIARAAEPPSAEGQFLIQVVAQQTGVAVSNARLHHVERASAEALVTANAALQDTVASLRRGMQIHQRLTKVATSGEGAAGIAEALHELTGMPVAIEDRYGNLRAWAGPDQPEPHPKPRADRRDELLRKLQMEERSVRDAGRVVALASPRPDVMGVLALIDPAERADASDIMAVEHAATVLAVELARLRGLADAELRLRRDLLHDLLTGTDDEGAYARAEALGYDLGQPHRVVVVEHGDSPSGENSDGQRAVDASSAKELTNAPQDRFLHAVRRALRDVRHSALLGTDAGAVVIVLPGETDWEEFRETVRSEQGGGRVRIGVGELYARPSDLPRSWREAQLALRLGSGIGNDDQATVFAGLGVFRMFAALPDLEDVQDFALRWLAPLIDYDSSKGTELVQTLTTYLDHGGRYETTATALSIHRSTLKYRLQRIRELSGYDLNEPETHFNLQLATKAWTTLGVMQHPSSEPATSRAVRPDRTR